MIPGLFNVLKNGDIKGLQELVEDCINLEQTTDGGETPLLVAARHGHIHIVDYLLKNKLSQITEKAFWSETAVFYATRYGHIPLVEYLLNNNFGEVSDKNSFDDTPLFVAANTGQIPMLKYLLSRPDVSILENL